MNQFAAGTEKRWVVVEDREGDIFEFFKAERAAKVDLSVRVSQPRRLQVVHGVVCQLPEVTADLHDYGTYPVRIHR